MNDVPDVPTSYEIRQVAAAPAGWFACYLTEYDATDLSKSQIATLPVAVWAVVVEDLDDGDEVSAIKACVVHLNGEVLPFDHVDRTFVCLAAPGSDPKKTALATLACESTKIIFRSEGLPS